MEFKDLLGVDIRPNDTLLSAISFQDLIDTVSANCPVIDEAAVRNTFRAMLEEITGNANYYIARNMDRLIAAAKK